MATGQANGMASREGLLSARALPSRAERLPASRGLRQIPTLDLILLALRWQAFALVCLACHMALVRELGPACFPLILACVVAVARYDSLAGFVVYLQILLYQNVALSLFSPGMTRGDYTALSGTSFIVTALLAISPVWRALRSLAAPTDPDPARRALNRLVLLVTAAVGIAGAYAMLGAVVAGPTPAAVGFRNATALLLAILIGLEIGRQWRYRTVAACLAVSMLLGVTLAAAEVADPDWYLGLVNATEFSNIKYASSDLPRYYTTDDVVARATQLPFNTNLLADFIAGKAYRLGGPNMHSISYGYVLAVTELMLLSLGLWAFVPPLLALSFLTGVKGAVILFAASALLHLGWTLIRSRRALIAAGLLFTGAYVAFGIRSGLRTGDFHVIGFIGGVNGFLKNPAGHGIGVGGNLSVGSLTPEQWQAFQHNGADVGLESAVGVLLYQMGVGCLAIFGAVLALLRAAPFRFAGRPRPTDILFIGLCISLVNGVFQEEAYSPYAAGLLCLLCGVVVANGRRLAAVPPRYL